MPSTVQRPLSGDIHVSVPLTNFAQKYLQEQTSFVAMRAMPNLPVQKETDLYYRFNETDFYRDNVKVRADGTESQGADWRVSTESYFTQVRALHKDITDRQLINQDAIINLSRSTTEFLMHQMLINREREFANTFMASASWTTTVTGVSASPTGSQFLQWNNEAADPIRDVRRGKTVVHRLTGYRPNAMLMGREVFDQLLDADNILARINGGATTALPAMVMMERLAQLLELDNIYVMDGIVNTALRDATDDRNRNNSFIGGKNALLYYRPATAGGMTPSAGVQFSWTGYTGATDSGIRMTQFRMEAHKAVRVEAEMAFDFKVTGADLGYYFASAVA